MLRADRGNGDNALVIGDLNPLESLVHVTEPGTDEYDSLRVNERARWGIVFLYQVLTDVDRLLTFSQRRIGTSDPCPQRRHPALSSERFQAVLKPLNRRLVAPGHDLVRPDVLVGIRRTGAKLDRLG